MNRSKQGTDGAEHHEAAVAFVKAAVDLRDSASLVVALGSSGIRKGLIELDDGSGDLQRRIRFLMDDIESSFRKIRSKLGA